MHDVGDGGVGGGKGLMDLWREAGMKVGGRGDWRRRVRERQTKRRVAMRVFGWYMMRWCQQKKEVLTENWKLGF